MINYVNDIAKVNKVDRFNGIIHALDSQGVKYTIQKFPNTLGNIIVNFNNGSDEKVVIGAHYDNFYGTPGANDNASACSILLNLINDFKDTDKTLEFVFFDLEECRRKGSLYYLQENKEKIKYCINFDMCGLGENTLYSFNGFNSGLEVNVDKVSSSHGALKYGLLPEGDANSFIEKGIPTLYIINSTNNDLKWFSNFEKGIISYNADFFKTMHRPSDTIDTINLKQIEKIYLYSKEIIENM